MTIVVIAGATTKEDLAAAFPAAGNVWIIVNSPAEASNHPDVDLYIDLDFVNEPDRKEALARLLPKPVMVNAVVSTLKELGYPFIRINGWPGFLDRPVHELVAPATIDESGLNALYQQLGRDFRIVPDTPGMISPRILATIINEAWLTWEEKVSTKEEIDTAMRLGTNYPMGPFEWGQRIGLDKIGGLLTVLGRFNGRYAPSAAILKAAKQLKYD